MGNGLDIIVDRLFDYAGMFPPAARDFEAALRESASLSATLKRPFMLNSDLVLDTKHAGLLCEVDLSSYGFTRDISVSLLITEKINDSLRIAERIITSIRLDDKPIVKLASLETKLPGEGYEGIISTLRDYCQTHALPLAVEPDLSTYSWEKALSETIDVLRNCSPRVTLKCRGSGPTGVSSERLARAIVSAVDIGIPLKVTGGFHHPIVERDRYGNAIGFLNLVVAVMLRHALKTGFTEDEIATLLVNPSSTVFSWSNGLTYGAHHLSEQALLDAKQKAPFSIGSCSLHEPDDDLARLFPM